MVRIMSFFQSTIHGFNLITLDWLGDSALPGVHDFEVVSKRYFYILDWIVQKMVSPHYWIQSQKMNKQH